MKASRVSLLAVGLSAALWVSSTAQAQSHEQTHQHIARLTCGSSTLTAETRWRVSPDTPLIWLEQKVWSRNAGTGGATALELEGHQRKRVAANRSGLDAVVLSWACLRSSSGASYILLGYACGSDDAERFCGGEREWYRLLDGQGVRLDVGLLRQDTRYEPLYKRLGVFSLMSEGVSMSSLVSSD